MPIITVPHPTLRLKANPVLEVDQQLSVVLAELEDTLTTNDKGVGLAAVQIDQPIRAFATFLEPNGGREKNRVFRTYLNPEITKTFGKSELGGDEESTPLEGCLSIPNYYGPVPRFFKIELSYQTVNNGVLTEHSEEFEDFFARVIQHELDHLNGILFTDYSLRYDLPLYKENEKTGKLEELLPRDRQIFEMI